MMQRVHPLSLRAKLSGSLIAATAWTVFPISLQAQVPPDSVPPDTVIAVEGLTVRGVRRTATLSGVAGVITLPASMPLPAVATVEDALRRMPFVQVRNNSRGMAEISVRGSESRQVAVLFDGVPLTLAWDHRTNPAIIPLMGARDLSLVRGLPSVLGGPNVLGGVVEVNLGRGAGTTDDTDDLRATVGVDHTGSRAIGISGVRAANIGTGLVSISAGAGIRSRDGFRVPDEVNDLTATDQLRTNSDLEEINGFWALRWEEEKGHWISLSASAFTAERGVPPELHVQEPRLWRYPKQWQTVAALTAGTGHRLTPFGVGDLEASIGFNAGRQDINAYESLAYDVVVETEAGEDRTITLRVLGEHSISASGELRAAASYADVNHTEILDGIERREFRQRLWSLGSEMAWGLPGATRFSLGVAMDGADTPETGGAPRLGKLSAWGGRVGVSTLALRPDLQIHASASTRARFPALRELYSGALGRFEPNPDLAPERLSAAELGATLRHTNFEIQTAVFHHELSDAVVRTSTPEGRYRRINRDRIRSTGVELLVSVSIGSAEIQGDLMLQDVSVQDPAAGDGPIRPEHMPELKAGFGLEAPILLGINGLTSIQHTGDQYCVHPDENADVPLDGKTRIDVGMRRSFRIGDGFWSAIRTTVSLDNLSDTAVFDQCGMPQAGRTVRFGVEFF